MTDPKNTEGQELSLDQLKDAAGGVTGDGSDHLQSRARFSLERGNDRVKLDTGSGSDRPDFRSKSGFDRSTANHFGGTSNCFVE